jgi:hypothetical protein
VVGEKKSRQIIWTMAFLIWVLTFFSDQTMASAVVCLMNGVLVGLLIGHRYLSRDDRFRMIGDAVFLLPLLYTLL